MCNTWRVPFLTRSARCLNKDRSLLRARLGSPTASAQPGNGGHQVIMLRPHMRDIPNIPFPVGYGIRPMSLNDIGLWTDIQRDAEPFHPITDGLFQDQFGNDPGDVARRCYIVTDKRGLGIGVVSAWYDHEFRDQDYGRIHWLAIRPSRQGAGLGKAALSYAMKKLAQWHERCYLVTSTERMAAIGLYLNFGFLPDLGPENARAAWDNLNARIRHSALTQALAGKAGEGETR